jgi:hypothetical protein
MRRRLLFTLIAGSALFAAALPATVMAHSHHGRRTHHRVVRHGRIRHERFGSSSAQTSPAGQSGDSQNAGTVTSVQNNRVTITLNDADRSTVTGMLTRGTEMKCEAPGQDQMQTEDRSDGGGDNASGANSGDDGPDNSGDNSGDNSRDDNGDAGDDQGEDRAQTCTLAAGMVVRHAELDVSSAGAVWHEIEVIS